ncbi:hypothetical protein Tco_0891344 [Tanacetum coccineum]|uniref:Retrovirus-related Pol polyprotein from transposon TNT 1-94-like beta-barrel domain-containing protein n=1 Tax=Tanacetum coccineum TaxID=301880 RepID=A0ABQ5C5K5_9ASTR
MIELGTDIAKISRKLSKPDKHGHGNGIENTRAGRMLSKSYTSPNAPIGGNPKGNDTRTMKETHQGLDFCTKRRTKEAQECHIMDCHAGSPCAHQNDPRAKNKYPMISIHQGPTANKTSASVSQVEVNITPPSNTSVKMPRVESVRPSGVIIKDWVSDDEDIFQSNDLQATDKPSFKRIEFTNARNESVKPKQAEKPKITTQNPKVDKRDWNEKITQKIGLGFGFTKKACFVSGSNSHLIKDCDFHEKKMAEKSVLKNIGKNTGQREIRPVWNSVQRINHKNEFVPSAVLTRSGRVPVSAAKQSSLRATTSTSTFRSVNTTTHTNRVNVSKLKTNAFYKSHSPIKRPFYKSTVLNTRISNEKVNTVRVNSVNTARQTTISTVKGTRVTAVKASAGNPQQALKNKGIYDSGCSRHMTGNKDFLTDYQDIHGGFVAFGGSARGVLLRVLGKANMYSFYLKNVVPVPSENNLFDLQSQQLNESKLWHRRQGHVNLKQ